MGTSKASKVSASILDKSKSIKRGMSTTRTKSRYKGEIIAESKLWKVMITHHILKRQEKKRERNFFRLPDKGNNIYMQLESTNNRRKAVIFS